MKGEIKLEQAATSSLNELCVSEDGYVRMYFSAVFVLQFIHFLSGLDDDSSDAPLKDGCAVSISGYTEWLSNTMPVISVGWDWHLDLTTGAPVYIRDGLPRTNLMVLDGVSAEDMGDQETGILLATLIDHLGWQDVISEYLVSRYS